jgi:hypothetical protein
MSDGTLKRYVGDTANPYGIALVDEKGVAYDLSGLSGSDLEFRMKNKANLETTIGTGTWTITDAVNGLAEYAWADADVNTVGLYEVKVGVTFANDKPLHFGPTYIQFQEL